MAVVLITHDLTIVNQVFRLRLRHAARRDARAQHHGKALRSAAAPLYQTAARLRTAWNGKAAVRKFRRVVTASGVRVSFMMRYGGLFKPELKELIAVDSLVLTLKTHETLGLVGESGSGKTTFGQSCCG